MKFITNDGDVEVVEINGKYNIYPSRYRAEFEHYLEHPPVIAGTYCPEHIDLFVVKEIVGRMILRERYNRVVLTEEEKASITELPCEPDVIYWLL